MDGANVETSILKRWSLFIRIQVERYTVTKLYAKPISYLDT